MNGGQRKSLPYHPLRHSVSLREEEKEIGVRKGQQRDK